MIPSEYDHAAILEKAAEVLETEGWSQGRYVTHADGNLFDSPSFTYCAVGAIRRAVSGNTYLQMSQDLLWAATHTSNLLSSKLRQPITAWNDQSGRTADEVIDLMKETAKDIRNERKPA
jgi:hypothetical protein